MYGFLICPFIGVLGGLFFLMTALYITEDRKAAERLVEGKWTVTVLSFSGEYGENGDTEYNHGPNRTIPCKFCCSIDLCLHANILIFWSCLKEYYSTPDSLKKEKRKLMRQNQKSFILISFLFHIFSFLVKMLLVANVASSRDEKRATEVW